MSSPSDIARRRRETQGVQGMEGHGKTRSASHLDLGDTKDHTVPSSYGVPLVIIHF